MTQRARVRRSRFLSVPCWERPPRPLCCPRRRSTTTLFTKPFPDSQLPAGYTGAKVTIDKPDKIDLKRKLVGRVLVEEGGGQSAIMYTVYETAPDAAYAITHPIFDKSGDFRVMGRAPGFGKQSRLIVGSITGKNVFGKKVTNGVTGVSVLQGNVGVSGVSISYDNEDSGDIQAAMKMLRAGIKHLRLVRGS
jgi:hypothetical protein